MTNTPEHPTPTSPQPITETDLIALVNHLEGLLMDGPGKGRGTLMRQSEVLDSIFNALIAANLKEAVTARFLGQGVDQAATARWLQYALQTQKQCMESLKAVSAMDYMESIGERAQAEATLALRSRHLPSDRKNR